ncbi:MAG TPA: PKD domain-containing protein, partial [Cytophagaceae bacterium]
MGNDTLICDYTGYELNTNGDPSNTYQWSTGESSPSIRVFENGTYSVKVTTPTGQQYTDQVDVTFKFERFKQANNWYFGNGGVIKFDPNSLQPTSTAGTANFNFPGGSSSISDNEGNPLFYTNGSTIYNRDNNVMETGLTGDPAATQNSIIVPDPGSAEIFFLFTIGNGALSYSTVDMRLNNGSGGVVKKNIPLANGVEDKITAVRTTDGKAIWVITHLKNSNTFLAYKVSRSGTTEATVAPVVQSSVGTISSGQKGYLKASPYGTRLMMASGATQLFDFNSNDGTVGNPVIFDVLNSYGVEFSKGGNNVYISTPSGTVYQANINLPTADSIRKSLTPIYQDNQTNFTGMQQGPDGRIYISKSGVGSNSVAVIENPDAPGALSRFNPSGLALAGGTGNFGIPNFIQHYFAYPSGPYFISKDTCVNQPVAFFGHSPFETKPYIKLNYQYFFGDGTSVNTKDAIHRYKSPGQYEVKFVVTTQECGSDTVRQLINIYPYPVLSLRDTIVCRLDTITVDASNIGAKYLWSNLVTNQTTRFSTQGKHEVIVGFNMCSIKEDFYLTLQTPRFSLPDEEFICVKENQTITLDDTDTSTVTYRWMPGNISSSRLVV